MFSALPKRTPRALPFARHRTLILLTCAALTAPVAHADIGDWALRLFSGKHTTLVTVDIPDGKLKIRLHGDIKFTDAEDDVLSLTGKAVLEERHPGRVLRMTFEADGKEVKHTFTINGKPQQFDAEARRWLEKTLPTMIRESGIQVEARVKRLHAEGGAGRVLEEAGRVHSDHTRRRYVNALLAQGTLTEAQTRDAVAVIARIDSDHERRSGLLAMLEKQPLSAAAQVALLEATAGMDSAFDQRSVLVALAPKLLDDESVASAWSEAIHRVDSDFDQRSVIDALAKRDTLSARQIEMALRSTQKIDSDFDHTQALTALLRHLSSPTSTQVQAYLSSAREIDSDFERRRVLNGLLERCKLDKDGFAGVLDSLRSMDSDFEIRNVLTTMARTLPADADLIDRYRRAARLLSDHDRQQAEKALDRVLDRQRG